MRRLLAVSIILAGALTAAEKRPVQWQTGILVDFESQTRLGQDALDQMLGIRPHDKTDFLFVVKTEEYTYFFGKTKDTMFDTVPHHTVNTPISFRPGRGSWVIVRDENGRNHRCILVKRVLDPHIETQAEPRLPTVPDVPKPVAQRETENRPETPAESAKPIRQKEPAAPEDSSTRVVKLP